MFKRLYLSLALLLIASTSTLLAQSFPSAEGRGFSVWVGGEISTFNPDYGCSSASPFSCGDHQLLGIGPFIDLNHLVFERIGAEGEARFLHWRGPGSGLTEASYLAGPRFGLMSFRRTLYVSGKVLIGDAHISVPSDPVGSGTYFAYAPGAVADLRITRRVSARADYEYQIWPSFRGIATATTTGKGGLTPNGFSFGVSYALLP